MSINLSIFLLFFNSPHHVSLHLPQLIPVLLFFLVYVLFNVGAGYGSSPYSLHIDQDHGYSVKRKTRVWCFCTPSQMGGKELTKVPLVAVTIPRIHVGNQGLQC